MRASAVIIWMCAGFSWSCVAAIVVMPVVRVAPAPVLRPYIPPRYDPPKKPPVVEQPRWTPPPGYDWPDYKPMVWPCGAKPMAWNGNEWICGS